MSNVKQPPGRDKSQNWSVCVWPGERFDGRGPGAKTQTCPCCQEYVSLCQETVTKFYFARCLNCFWESPGSLSESEAVRLCRLVVALASP